LKNIVFIFKFSETKEIILEFVKDDNPDCKLEGINKLIECYSSTFGLSEQFDLLHDNLVYDIINALINKPNPELYGVYYQIGTFICSLLFSTRFKIDANNTKYKLKKSDLALNYYFLIYNDNIIDESNLDILNFLHESVYELTTQKDLLLKCDNIYKISYLFVSFLSINENIYDLQFICYIILRRIYFIYPEYRSNIEDILSSVIVNLVKLNENIKNVISIKEYNIFIFFLH